MPAIRRAAATDAEALSTFARAIFLETFGPDNRPEDIEAYLAQAFSPALQEQEILDERGMVLLVEDEGGLAGYAQLARGGSDKVEATSPVELKRFYVARRLQGTGAAKLLMARVLDEARAMQGDVIWLGVFERNPRAIAFYRKEGFERVAEHHFLLGSDLQLDWIMARPLA